MVLKRVRPEWEDVNGGFCGPRVQEILARELNQKLEDMYQIKQGHISLLGETKTENYGIEIMRFSGYWVED